MALTIRRLSPGVDPETVAAPEETLL